MCRLSFIAALLAVGLFGCAEQRTVTISTRPVPASVRIDGADAGVAPITRPFVFDGATKRHEVSLTRPGFKDQVVEVTRNTDPNLVVELKPLTRTVTLNVQP